MSQDENGPSSNEEPLKPTLVAPPQPAEEPAPLITVPPEPEPEPSSVDEVAAILDEYREAKDPTNDVVLPEKRDELIHGVSCAYCNRTGHTQCYVCLKTFCPDHSTKDDHFLCSACGAQSTELRPNFTMGPLKDDEGAVHEGKQITPLGDTYQVSKYIDSLSDSELLAMMAEYQRLVKQAEQLLYSRIIVANTVSGAIGERNRKKRLEGRAGRVEKQADGSKTLAFPATQPRTKKAASGGAADTIINVMQQMDPTERAKLVALLQQAQAQAKK